MEEVLHEMLVLMLQHVSSRASGFPVASPCLWGKPQNLSFSNVSKQVVMSFYVAGVALRDIPACLITCRKSFCVAGVILLRRFQTMSCSFRGRCAPHLHFTLYTLHSSLHTHTLHFTLHTLHYTTLNYNTLHSTLHTLHFTLHTLNCTLHTLHSTLHTLHSSLHTPHSTLYTPHFKVHTLHSTLHTLYFTLCTPRFTLHTPDFTL